MRPNPLDFEGLWRPDYCPRGCDDCQALSQIISQGHGSFMCVGENDGSRREIKQDKYRVCFKNSAIDEMTDYDKRDLIQTQATMAWALSIIEELEQPEGEQQPGEMPPDAA